VPKFLKDKGRNAILRYNDYNTMAFITDRDIGEFGRSGSFKTRRGTVTTPTFMPDGTRGAVKSLTPEMVASTGVQVILSNTYHLHLQPGESVVKKLGGLHEFSKWQGPILTDSGGFQVYSLSKIRKITEEGVVFKDPRTGDEITLTPEKSMQIQLDLGADMINAFDDLAGLDEESKGRATEAYERTHRWLDRSVAEFKNLTKDLPEGERPLLFGIVQGGLDEDLRLKSLEMVQNSGVDGIAIGGLSVGEPRSEMQRILRTLAPHYDKNRPRFLLGVGDPRDVRFAIEHGIDMLDCVLPTRNARHGTAWVADDKSIHLTNEQFAEDSSPILEGCDCSTCEQEYSKGFLRHQFKVGEPLAGTLVSIHNLRYLTRLCEEFRNQA